MGRISDPPSTTAALKVLALIPQPLLPQRVFGKFFLKFLPHPRPLSNQIGEGRKVLLKSPRHRVERGCRTEFGRGEDKSFQKTSDGWKMHNTRSRSGAPGAPLRDNTISQLR